MGNAAAQGKERLANLLEVMRKAQTDLQDVEVKTAVGGVPKTLADSVSALTNGSGGLVILGLSEKDGFVAAEGFDAHASMDALSDICANKLMPPVRAQISIEEVDGASIVVADIPETAPQDKPCYVENKGMYKGSFIRTGDGDRLLTPYEINRLNENRAQPKFDLDVVAGATIKDLDAAQVKKVLEHQRALNPRIFDALSDEHALEALNITARTAEGKQGITLGGLLALGTYPQHFEPCCTITVSCYKEAYAGPAAALEPTTSQSMAGSIPYLIADAVALIAKQASYPEAAVREALCNALVHRDYSPMGCGIPVKVNLYADRLEIISPGGLFGAVTKDTLGELGITGTRNRMLAAILESVPYPGGGFVLSNGNGGIKRLKAELALAGYAQPSIQDALSYFSITIKNAVTEVAGIRSLEQTIAERPYLHGSVLSVYKAIFELGFARTSDVVEATAMPRSTVSYALKNLLKKGDIQIVDSIATRNSPQRRYKIA